MYFSEQAYRHSFTKLNFFNVAAESNSSVKLSEITGGIWRLLLRKLIRLLLKKKKTVEKQDKKEQKEVNERKV